jgi:hypothetical protein
MICDCGGEIKIFAYRREQFEDDKHQWGATPECKACKEKIYDFSGAGKTRALAIADCERVWNNA